MNPFETAPEFYLNDNRMARDYNPINNATLITKYERLLPADSVRDKTILDLGCCIGAAGQWALSFGAKHYTGVEIQSDYFTQAKQLLSHWQGQYRIIMDDIRSYLESAENESFDIVVASGVLQVFIDPQFIILELCRVAKDMVSIEAILPTAIRTGQVNPNLKIIQFCRTSSNVASSQHQRMGMGSLISKPAMDLLFKQRGFVKNGMDLFPKYSEDNKAFSMPMEDQYHPLRYFERYIRQQDEVSNNNLEFNMINGHGALETWEAISCHSHADAGDKKKAPWVFDKAIANEFVAHARQHIPEYDDVIDLSLDIVRLHGKSKPKIIDVGCASGETLMRLKALSYDKIYGVDNSESMLSVARDNLINVPLSLSDDFPKEFGSFDIVIANWTLHFVNRRIEYLNDIYQYLNPNGFLILTEKTCFGDVTKKLYYDFKRKQGVSEEKINTKEQSLKGVLSTASPSWYLAQLERVGFDVVDIVSAKYGFVTYLAIKL